MMNDATKKWVKCRLVLEEIPTKLNGYLVKDDETGEFAIKCDGMYDHDDYVGYALYVVREWSSGIQDIYTEITNRETLEKYIYLNGKVRFIDVLYYQNGYSPAMGGALYYPLYDEKYNLTTRFGTKNIDFDKLIDYISTLENQSFEGWDTFTAVGGYKTALTSIKEFILK